MKHIGKLIFGIVISLFGLLLILENLNIITNLTFLENLSLFWPIGLILSGSLIFFKQRKSGFLILILSIIIGVFTMIVPTHLEVNELKVEEFVYPYSNQNNVYYDISIGGSKLTLKNIENSENLVKVNSQTTFSKRLDFEVNNKENITIVKIEENGHFELNELFLLDKQTSNLDIEINSKPNSTLNLNYGAVDGTLDLRNLNVKELIINSGASHTEVYLGDKPINIDISTGASQINFHFPNDIGIRVESDSGASSLNFQNFSKIGNKYFSEDFNSSKEFINIKVSSGVSSINGEFY